MEIERKFLVNKILWQELHNPVNATFIQQAYLSTDPKCTVRIRITDSKALITIKGETKGISREEFEYNVPLKDGLEIIQQWPEWIDKEVTGDPRYFNLQLAINPINHWQ